MTLTKAQVDEAVKYLMTNPDYVADASVKANPILKTEIETKIKNCVNANPAPNFLVPFSIKLVMQMGKDLGPGWCLILDNSSYIKFIGDDQTLLSFDPTTHYSSLLAGHLGVMYGVSIFTDAFYPPEDQTLPCDFMFAMSADGTKGYSVHLA